MSSRQSTFLLSVSSSSSTQVHWLGILYMYNKGIGSINNLQYEDSSSEFEDSSSPLVFLFSSSPLVFLFSCEPFFDSAPTGIFKILEYK